jgi:hypothetical protein
VGVGVVVVVIVETAGRVNVDVGVTQLVAAVAENVTGAQLVSSAEPLFTMARPK